ncbi:MAG: arylesterase [Rhodobacteraceae bacterium]|nr:arylesterase [Paracoccaceae bacterium]
MSEVLAFGDSLTWGSRPDGLGRHALRDRWPTVLAEGLPGVHIVAEGLRGRTTAFDRPTSSCDVNGARVLPALLHSHAPLDLIIVMLGTNDIWEDHPLWQVEAGLSRVVEVIRHHAYRLVDARLPDILLVAPPPIIPSESEAITEAKIARSRDYPASVARVAKTNGLPWFDAGTVASPSPLDGVHLDATATRAIGMALREPVSELLAQRERV